MKFHKNEESSMEEFRAAYAYAKQRSAARLIAARERRVHIFRAYWRKNFRHLPLLLSAEQILSYLDDFPSIASAAIYIAADVYETLNNADHD